MKTLLLFALISIAQLHAQNLEDYRWKNRVVLLFSESPNDSIVEKQKSLFQANQDALSERDMIVLRGSNDLKKDLKIPDDFLGVVLIGKDGSIKLSKPFLVEPKTLFSLIDGMPMRKAEMRKHKNKSGE